MRLTVRDMQIVCFSLLLILVAPVLWWMGADLQSDGQLLLMKVGVTIVLFFLPFIVLLNLFRIEISETHRGDLSWSGRTVLGGQILTEQIYQLFRLAAQNKVIAYAVGVTTVLITGGYLGLPGENQVFSFIYATLLFFQVLIARDYNILSLSDFDRLSKPELEDLDDTKDPDESVFSQRIENIGTTSANNVRVRFRIYSLDGKPIDAPCTADLKANARSIAAGERTAQTDVIIRYTLPDELEGEKHVLHVVAQTGEGVTVLSDSSWRCLP